MTALQKRISQRILKASMSKPTAKSILQVFEAPIREYILNTLLDLGFRTTTTMRCGGYGKVEQIVGKHKGGLCRFLAEAECKLLSLRNNQDESEEFELVRYNLIAKKKSSHTGYTELQRDCGLQKLDQIVEFFDQYKVLIDSIEATGYPPTRKFNTDRFVLKPNKAFASPAQIKTALVVSLVTINRGYNTVDLNANNMECPDYKCWFLLECVGYRGAVFNIISDGHEFYPVERVTSNIMKFRATVKIVREIPKATVDVDNINITDQELINTAITHWVSEHL